MAIALEEMIVDHEFQTQTVPKTTPNKVKRFIAESSPACNLFAVQSAFVRLDASRALQYALKPISHVAAWLLNIPRTVVHQK